MLKNCTCAIYEFYTYIDLITEITLLLRTKAHDAQVSCPNFEKHCTSSLEWCISEKHILNKTWVPNTKEGQLSSEVIVLDNMPTEGALKGIQNSLLASHFYSHFFGAYFLQWSISKSKRCERMLCRRRNSIIIYQYCPSPLGWWSQSVWECDR